MTTDGPSIGNIEAAAYTIPTERPEGDGTLTWDSTTWVVVQAASTDPRAPRGLGWTYGPAAAATVIRDLLADVVVGRDAEEPAPAWDAMVRAVRNAGRPGLVSMAISAVDTALWDLAARLLDVRLTTLLGGGDRPVAVYGSGGFTTETEQELLAQLEEWQRLRLPRMKIKIGESWGTRIERDLARVALVRQTVGEDVELFADANGGYAVGPALRVARCLEGAGVTWFEEPVSSDDHEGLARLRAGTDLDIAAGEYGDSLAYFARLLSAGAVDCVQVDVTRCGGYTEWRRIAALAAAHGLQVSGHCAPALHVPVAAGTPNLRHLEWFVDHVRIESRFLEPVLDPTGGTVNPIDAPGHGLELRDADLASYRVA